MSGKQWQCWVLVAACADFVKDVHIEANEQALAAANGGVLKELERLQLEAAKRQMWISIDAQAG